MDKMVEMELMAFLDSKLSQDSLVLPARLAQQERQE